MNFIFRLNFSIIILNLIAVLLAILGIFTTNLVIIAIGVSVMIGLLYPKTISFNDFIDIKYIPICFIGMIVIFISLFNHDTYFGGRDNGIYANSALSIVKTGTYVVNNDLVSSYPGFEISKKYGFQPSFYLGYISWLAVFISIFGYKAVVLSNSVLLFFGLINLYLIYSKLVGRAPILPLIVFVTTFPFLWFSRSTYSENLAFMLSVFVINSILEYKFVYLVLALSLSLVVRIESVFLVASLTPVLIYFIYTRKIIFKNTNLLLIILCVLFVFYYYFQIDQHYLNQFLKLGSNISNNLFKSFTISSTDLTTINEIQLPKTALEFNIPKVTTYLLAKYNLFYFIFIFPALVFSIIRFLKDKKIDTLMVVLLFILPQLFYLFNPMITFDQPWFLRRFLPVLLPLSIGVFYNSLFKQVSIKYSIVVTVIILLINISMAFPILFFSENHNIYDQLEVFEQLPINKKDDLIIVDYDYTGNFKLAEPLYFIYNFSTLVSNLQSLIDYKSSFASNTPSVYGNNSFVVPKSVCNYNNIYLLSTQNSNYKQIFYNQNMENVWSTTIKYDQLQKECELFRITPNKTFHEMAHINVADVINYCQNIPSKIKSNEVNLVLYKINRNFIGDFFNCQ